MATGREMQITKQVGEYLVAAELGRQGFITTTFTGNIPDFDILAINNEFETIPIQVKTIKGETWQFDAERFLDISISGENVQTVRGKVELKNPDLICIFVKIDSYGKDQFYIFKLKELQDIIFYKYNKHLESKKGIRPKNPKSTHVNVTPEDLVKYLNNWPLTRQHV